MESAALTGICPYWKNPREMGLVFLEWTSFLLISQGPKAEVLSFPPCLPMKAVPKANKAMHLNEVTLQGGTIILELDKAKDPIP